LEPKEIRELIELVSRSDFSTFELEREGFRIKLVRRMPAPVETAPALAPAMLPAEGASRPASTAAPAVPAPSAAGEAGSSVGDGVVDMRSPIVGTFFASPAPDAPPFVEVGQRVRKGQVMCIVEAMKVMNEIEAELEAEVVEVAVRNGQPVEFGEVLFRLRP
jgi:acetyl-CoA carboxylase biotin carboxyl carrier protein